LEDFDDKEKKALDGDDLRMIRVLLATNEGKVRVGKCTGQSFPVDMGTPIGDCLSPLLFIFYLSRAILEVKEKWVEKTGVQDWTVRSYADDVDIFRRDDWSQDEQDQLKTLLHNTLEKWGMQLNEDKEESYYMSNKREEYLHIKKLGVMLDRNRHVSHTIQRAQQAFQRYWPIWYRKNRIKTSVQMLFYRAFVLPHFMNGMYAHVLNSSDMQQLEVVHRRHLRRITRTHYPYFISNVHLYQRAGAKRLEHYFMKQRWKLFGSILRDQFCTGYAEMESFFLKKIKFGIRRPQSLPGLLNKELNVMGAGFNLHSKQDLTRLQEMSLDRCAWKLLSDEVVKRNMKLRLDSEWTAYRRGHSKRLEKKREDKRMRVQLQKEKDEQLRAEEADRIRRTTKLGSRTQTRLLFRNSRRVMAGDLLQQEIRVRQELDALNEKTVVMFETEREMSKITKSGRIVRKPKFADEW